MSKKCTSCGVLKDYTEFYVQKTRKYMYLKSSCKECCIAASRANYQENRLSILLKKKAYYRRYRTLILSKAKFYYQNNKEQVSNRSKAYYYQNREAILNKLAEKRNNQESRKQAFVDSWVAQQRSIPL